MKTQFTPGPWQHNAMRNVPADLACAVWAGDTPICTTSFSVGKYNEVDAVTRDANARLIAAAPDLLGACQSALRALLDNTCPGPMDADAIAGLRAAIANAQS